MDPLTPHELLLMKKMAQHHQALMPKLSREERDSLEHNVNLRNIELIQSWLGTGEEIERMLFWVRGGKYDDPEWHALQPVDEPTRLLYDKARHHYEQLRTEAVECQIRSDLTLYSQFNAGLLFTGLTGAVRCVDSGRADKDGKFFKGIEWRCIGSVEDNINSITIYPLDSAELEIHFGSRINDRAQGILVYAGDSFSLIQLANLIGKDLPKFGFETAIRDNTGRTVSIDPKAIRRAAHKEEDTGYGDELILDAGVRVEGTEKAIEMADNLSRCFYDRFGLETECYKIGKKYANFFIMRNDNFDRFLPETPVKNKGLVLFTATLVCRRCRRELEAFRDFAKLYPDVTFALVNLASPQFRFYERVFGDMGGGDPKNLRDHAVGSTPFVIIYAPDEKGVLQFAEYYGTEKDEAPPSVEKSIAIFDKYFK